MNLHTIPWSRFPGPNLDAFLWFSSIFYDLLWVSTIFDFSTFSTFSSTTTTTTSTIYLLLLLLLLKYEVVRFLEADFRARSCTIPWSLNQGPNLHDMEHKTMQIPWLSLSLECKTLQIPHPEFRAEDLHGFRYGTAQIKLWFCEIVQIRAVTCSGNLRDFTTSPFNLHEFILKTVQNSKHSKHI